MAKPSVLSGVPAPATTDKRDRSAELIKPYSQNPHQMQPWNGETNRSPGGCLGDVNLGGYLPVLRSRRGIEMRHQASTRDIASGLDATLMRCAAVPACIFCHGYAPTKNRERGPGLYSPIRRWSQPGFGGQSVRCP